MANGQEQINKLIAENDLNQLDVSTLERLVHKSYGDNIGALYGVLTKGGDKRFIDQYQFGQLESPESLQYMDMGVREKIKRNPDFADTLKAADVPGFKQELREMDEPLLKGLIKMIFGM